MYSMPSPHELYREEIRMKFTCSTYEYLFFHTTWISQEFGMYFILWSPDQGYVKYHIVS